MKDTQIKVPKKQQGMVLVVALVMLLLITILGVSAVSRSKIGTQVAGNSMYSMLVYQGAESAIARTVTGSKQMNIKSAASSSPVAFKVPSSFLPSEKVHGGGSMESKGTVTSFKDAFICPTVNNMSYGSTTKCKVFEIDVKTNLAATAARARHMEGRALPIATP